jgi:hypothetical protein
VEASVLDRLHALDSCAVWDALDTLGLALRHQGFGVLC